MSGWIDSLSGLGVKLTGDFRRSSLDMTQKELEHVLRSRCAIRVADIRRTSLIVQSCPDICADRVDDVVLREHRSQCFRA